MIKIIKLKNSKQKFFNYFKIIKKELNILEKFIFIK